MKILVISHMFPAQIRPNEGTFVLQQVEALQKMGHEVQIVCPTPWLPKWMPVKLEKWKFFQDLPKYEFVGDSKVYFKRGIVIPRGFDWTRGSFFYFSNWFFFRNLMNLKHFDVIHSHTVSPDGDIGLYLKRKYAIPFIVTIHGADLYYLAPSSKMNYTRILKVLKNADGIGLVSQSLKDALIKLYSPSEGFPEFKVIYNGIKIYENYEPVDWRGSSKDFKILSISSLIDRKNLRIVFQALRDLKKEFRHLKYYIIGDGWHRESHIKLVKKLDLTDTVVFLGSLPHKTAMSYLREADLFVLPSYNESWGVVYIESMYFGKLTVASLGEGIAEIIKHGINGFLADPYDYKSIKKIINTILKDKALVYTVGKNAQKNVWPRFSWENNVRAYLKLYNNATRI